MAKVQKDKDTKSKSTKKAYQNKGTGSNAIKMDKAKVDILKKEISGIFIVAFAVFLIVVTNKESQTGIIGKTINMFTHTLLGKGSSVLPYVVLVIGIMRLLNIVIANDSNQIAAILGFFVCYIMYIPLTEEVVYNTLIGNIKLIELINSAKEFGMNNLGGGIIGNLITFICLKLVGRNGTVIILGTMIFTFTILFTNQSIIGGVKIVINFIKKIFNYIYNFIFVEVDEANNKHKSSAKDKADSRRQDERDDNIKIFDYSNTHIDNKQKNTDITQLKLDEQKNKEIGRAHV